MADRPTPPPKTTGGEEGGSSKLTDKNPSETLDDGPPHANGVARTTKPLPPPPPALDLKQFDSKFSLPSSSSLSSKKKITSTAGTSATRVVLPPVSSSSSSRTPLPPPPPPPPPLPSSRSRTTTTTTTTMTTTSQPLPPPPLPPLSLARDKVAPAPAPSLTDSDSDSDDSAYGRRRDASVPTVPPSHAWLAPRQCSLPVLLRSTEGASRSVASRDGASLARLFGAADPADEGRRLPPFRSVGRSVALRWDQIRVRFLDEETLERPATDAEASSRTERVCRRGDGDDGNEVEASLRRILYDRDHDDHDDHDGRERRRRRRSVEPLPLASADSPRLRAVRAVLDDTTDHLPHDMIDCPVVGLFVADTSDGDYVRRLRDLRDARRLPRPYRDGRFDPTSLRCFHLLLHDNTRGPADFDEGAALLALRSAFSNQICAVLRINSDRETGGMDDADRTNVRRFVATLVADAVLPAMERRVFHLNALVNNAKRGVKNVFKSLWRKPKDGVDGSHHGSSSSASSLKGSHHGGGGGNGDDGVYDGVKYRYDSIESQIRLLADSLFLVRDYESALSVYRLVKDDYKSDRSTTYYASAHEMMALCHHGTDPLGANSPTNNPSRYRDLHAAVETALYSYTRAAEEERYRQRPPGGGRSSSSSSSPPRTLSTRGNRLATRLCLVLSSTPALHRRRPRETADLLASASSHETPLPAAILLERAAVHYADAGHPRRRAFHALMAGHAYRAAGVEGAARRCLVSACAHHASGEWASLRCHLEAALAGQSESSGRDAAAVGLYRRLVGYPSHGGGDGGGRGRTLRSLYEVVRRNRAAALEAARATRGDDDDDDDESEDKVPTPSTEDALLEMTDTDLPRVDDATLHVDSAHDDRERRSGDDDDDEAEAAARRDMDARAEAEARAAAASARATAADVLRELEEDASRRPRANHDRAPRPAVRARREPVLVRVTVANPCDVRLPMNGLQLVATSVRRRDGRVCTNRYAADARESNHAPPTKEVVFRGTPRTFSAPDFLRYERGDDDNDKDDNDEQDEPHFLVDKRSVTVEPNGKLRVSMAVCPMVEGTLLIEGMRWRVFHDPDMWVYHEFKVKGPLLQDTPEHRANRARAEPQLLRSVVSKDAPSLVLDLVDAQEQVLQGEIRRWTLRVTNVGTAPATNLTLRADAPWLSVGTPVGPGGTLASLSSEPLAPGDVLETPALVRVTGGGRRRLRLSLRYGRQGDDDGDDDDETAPLVRHARRTIDFAVLPSLFLAAKVSPSPWEKDAHLLSVEMTNYRGDRNANVDLVLRSLSVVSRNYRVVPIDHQIADEDDDDAAALPLTVGWQERVTMHYRLLPRDAPAAVVVAELPFAPAAEDDGDFSAVVPNTDFLCSEHAHDQYTTALRLHAEETARRRAAEERAEAQPRSVHQIRRDNRATTTTEDDPLGDDGGDERRVLASPNSVDALCPPTEDVVALVCAWSVREDEENDRPSHGQHHLRGLTVRPNRPSDDDDHGACPLVVTARYETDVAHDFERSGSLPLDLEITVRNRRVRSRVGFEFAFVRRPDLELVGAETFEHALDGGEELTLPLRVVLSDHGVHDLQNVRLTVVDGAVRTPHVLSSQWIVRVHPVVRGS